ncbi:MAG: hypothetical protein JO037_04490 [Actinobacteria bacterium]|nr:hypothetical protein [Actinomycetota bacterium]
MVCYARPAGRLAVIFGVALVVFYRPASHFLGTTAVLAAVTIAIAGAAVAAALALATFMPVRRRRAAAGGCVSCRFRCQHAMTEPARRPWLMTTTDRGPATVPLPMPAVRSAAPAAVPAVAGGPAAAGDPAAPRWPDRPLYRGDQPSRWAPQTTAVVPSQERAAVRGAVGSRAWRAR